MNSLDDLVISRKAKDTALIVIDVVNDICAAGFAYDRKAWDRTLIVKMVEDSLAPFIKLSKGQVPIVFINSEYTPTQFKEDPIPIENFCVKGTQGADFYKINKSDATHIFTKHHWSAFYEHPYEGGLPTRLHSLLQQEKIKTIMISGVTGTHCVPKNVEHASKLGYQVVVLRDCIASRGDEERRQQHMKNLKAFEQHSGIIVVNSNQILYST
ncbi:cysteine hydrolase [Candidatus Woesearchaeota archaeon]|nr:cysteine hydrolase [Candidatus Woesearchaeota archaeon]